MKTAQLVLRAAGASLVFVCLAGVLYPVCAPVREHPHRTSCRSKLKQLATAVLIYAGDYDERFPLATWMDGLQPYTKNSSLYTCPDLERTGAQYGYALNYRTVGLDSRLVSDPSRLILIFDTDALGKNMVANTAAIGARSRKQAHRNKPNGVFANGSVDMSWRSD